MTCYHEDRPKNKKKSRASGITADVVKANRRYLKHCRRVHTMRRGGGRKQKSDVEQMESNYHANNPKQTSKQNPEEKGG